ncbi:MAG: hypothetical protein HZC40_06140 [Chloroflexi bacterium]|nr:hypothetical protein [Chloroflexota bacterium]
MRDQIPPRLTRMQAVANSTRVDAPMLVMDTAPAAVLGALEDERVRAHRTLIVANIGNFHTLAFRYRDGAITGVFEHHTGELKPAQLENFIEQLADGTLTHDAIFNSNGHGALMLNHQSDQLNFFAIVGPRRNILARSRLHPYLATPFGDMMLAGCFGLARAYALLNPNVADEITRALDKGREIA